MLPVRRTGCGPVSGHSCALSVSVAVQRKILEGVSLDQHLEQILILTLCFGQKCCNRKIMTAGAPQKLCTPLAGNQSVNQSGITQSWLGLLTFFFLPSLLVASFNAFASCERHCQNSIRLTYAIAVLHRTLLQAAAQGLLTFLCRCVS